MRKPLYVLELGKVYSDGIVTLRTSGHSCVITRGATDGAPTFSPKMTQLVADALASQLTAVPGAGISEFFEPPSCSDCVGDQPPKCPQCHGGKNAIRYCDACDDAHHCVCDRCGGYGFTSCETCDRALVVKVDDGIFDARLVAFTMGQMPGTGADRIGVLSDHGAQVLALRNEECTAIVMCMRANEDEIQRR